MKIYFQFLYYNNTCMKKVIPLMLLSILTLLASCGTTETPVVVEEIPDIIVEETKEEETKEEETKEEETISEETISEEIKEIIDIMTEESNDVTKEVEADIEK